MGTEDKTLVYFCFSVSVIGIIIIYYSSLHMIATPLYISEITGDMVGREVRTTGFVSRRYDHPDGHIFITIEDDNGEEIQIPLFSGFANSFEKLNSQNARLDEIHPGSLIDVRGVVGEYRNQLQIVPRKPDDLRILYD